MRPFTDPAPMAATLGVWLCAVPFVLLVVGWLWGLKVAGLAAGGLLVALVAICWTLCAAKAGATWAHCSTVPIQVFATPDSRLLFVANQGTRKSPGTTVSAVNLETLEVVKATETGPGAHGVVVSRDGRYAYVTNTYADSVSAIDVKDLKVVATIPVGKGPNGISVTP